MAGYLVATSVALAVEEPRIGLGYELGVALHDEFCSLLDDDVPNKPSDFELSLGKITDILSSDYPAFFERKPEFGIYHEDIELVLGPPFDNRPVLKGRPAYTRAMKALRTLARNTVSDGKVLYRVGKGENYGHHLKVRWEFRGHMLRGTVPIHIVAISLYSVAPQGPPTLDDHEVGSSRLDLTHRVHRHVISFKEVHPPSLRSLLMGWLPQMQPEPALACKVSL